MARYWARPAATTKPWPISTRRSASTANYAQAYANRGLVYRETGKYDLALADYNKAIGIDPNYAITYLGRGIVYRAEKKAALAL